MIYWIWGDDDHNNKNWQADIYQSLFSMKYFICSLCNAIRYTLNSSLGLLVFCFVYIVYQQMAHCSHKPNLTNIQSVLQEQWLIKHSLHYHLLPPHSKCFTDALKHILHHFSRDKCVNTHTYLWKDFQNEERSKDVQWEGFLFAVRWQLQIIGIQLHSAHRGRYTQKYSFWCR